MGTSWMGPVVALLAASTARAEDPYYPPSFDMLQSTAKRAAISMQCEGKAPFRTLHCRFQRVEIRQRSEKEVADFLEFRRKGILEESEEKWSQQIAVCSQLPELQQKIAKDVGMIPDERKAAVAQIAGLVRICAAGCKPSDRSCWAAAFRPLAEQEARTCRVMVTPFEEDLVRVGPSRWANKTKAEGLCKVVAARTIEDSHGDSAGWGLWKLTEVVTSAEHNELCDFLVNQPIAYETGTESFPVNCRDLKFAP
jgi:hypothetical protein